MTRLLLALALATGVSAGVLAATPDDTDLRSREGVAALLRGQYEKAITAYDAALESPDLPDARRANILNDRGVAKWRLKDIRGAIADFNEAVALFPDYAIIYNNRGNALMDLGRPDEAVADFTRAIELSPAYGAAYSNRGNARLALGQREGAVEDFRQAVKLMPNNAVPYNGRGQAQNALARPHAAVRDFSRALALNAKYASARRNRAAAYRALGRDDEAVEDFNEVIAQEPKNAMLYVARGRARAEEKKYNGAFKDLSEAIELAPDLAEAHQSRGSLYFKLDEFERAREDLSKAIALDPDNAQAHIDRARTLLRIDMAEEGLKDAERAVELAPMNADTLAVRGDLREATGRYDAARLDYKAALAIDPGLAAPRESLKAMGIEPPPEPKSEPLGEAVEGWVIARKPSGDYVATHPRFPKVSVRLEMYGSGEPEILGWYPQKHELRGIGLLHYRAGAVSRDSDEHYVYVAIVDLWQSEVEAIEPHAWGDREAEWQWKQASVVVTDPDGVANEVELRRRQVRQRSEERRYRDDGHWSQRQRRRRRDRREPGGGGLFDWLFQR